MTVYKTSDMRRIVLMMMGLCLFMNMQAQTTERAKQQVAEVRRQYAEARKMVEHSNLPHQDYYNDLTVKRRQMIGGPGQTFETIRYFFESDYDEEVGGEVAQVYFITRSYNVAAMKHYEEFLFDATTAQLIFAFLQADEYDGTQSETRYYWGPEGLVHQVQNGHSEVDDMLTQRLAYDLVQSFNLLVNRNYE